MSWKIVVMDDTLTGEAAVDLSDRIRNSLLSHQYASTKANNAALVIGQFVSCNIGKKKDAKKPVLKASSLFFEDFHKLRKVRLTSVGFHLRYIPPKPAPPLQQLSCTSSKTPSLIMQYAKGASSKITSSRHHFPVFLHRYD